MMALVSHRCARSNTSGSQIRSQLKLNYSTIINFLSSRVHDVWPVMRLKLSASFSVIMSVDPSRAVMTTFRTVESEAFPTNPPQLIK